MRKPASDKAENEKDRPDEFFYALRSYWTPAPPAMRESFLSAAKEITELETQLLQDPDLTAYDLEIYPELGSVLDVGKKRGKTEAKQRVPREALHLCNRQLRLMESAFAALRLNEYHAHPLNRPWMNVFRRWSAAPTLRRLWPSLRGGYSKEFVRFAEYQLNLSVDPKLQVYVNPAVARRGLQGKFKPSDGVPVTDLPRQVETLLAELANPSKRARVSAQIPKGLALLGAEIQQEWPWERYGAYYKPFGNHWITAIVSDRQDDEGLGAGVWGIGMIASDEIPSRFLRLMVWVRPAYRGLGLGMKLLDVLCDGLAEDVKKDLIVVLPPLPRDKPGYAQEMAGWLRFYGRKGLVRIPIQDAERWLNVPLDPEGFCLSLPRDWA